MKALLTIMHNLFQLHSWRSIQAQSFGTSSIQRVRHQRHRSCTSSNNSTQVGYSLLTLTWITHTKICLPMTYGSYRSALLRCEALTTPARVNVFQCMLFCSPGWSLTFVAFLFSSWLVVFNSIIVLPLMLRRGQILGFIHHHIMCAFLLLVMTLESCLCCCVIAAGSSNTMHICLATHTFGLETVYNTKGFADVYQHKKACQ